MKDIDCDQLLALRDACSHKEWVACQCEVSHSMGCGGGMIIQWCDDRVFNHVSDANFAAAAYDAIPGLVERLKAYQSGCVTETHQETTVLLEALRKEIRAIRDTYGDAKCHLDLRRLFAMLPEGYDPPTLDVEIAFLRGQVDKLRQTCDGLAARVCDQSELLSRHAEKTNPPVRSVGTD